MEKPIVRLKKDRSSTSAYIFRDAHGVWQCIDDNGNRLNHTLAGIEKKKGAEFMFSLDFANTAEELLTVVRKFAVEGAVAEIHYPLVPQADGSMKRFDNKA